MTDAQAQALTEAINALVSMLQSIFQAPDSSQLAALWGLGFSMPLSLYLVAYAVGLLVNFWRR